MKKQLINSKSLLLLLIICASVSLNSCKKSVYNVSIDVQSGFFHDKVRVFIDGEEFINSVYTTNELLGVAGSSDKKKIASGKHELKVIINESFIQTENFSVSADLYIGISFQKQPEKIYYTFSASPFLYE
jgi:hypothetical protein